MIVGVPKEIKSGEARVGLTPGAVGEYVAHGHEVLVESKAGADSSLDDAAYAAAGAKIVATAGEVFARADMIVKVKEPQPKEWAQLRPGQILFTYLHLAADPEQAKGLLGSGVTAVAYETVTDVNGGLPLLAPMSEVAGRLSIQAAATALQKPNGGRGILLGGVPGVPAGKVVVIGGGVVGTEAARVAVGIGADVIVIDRSLPRLRALDDLFQGRVKTRFSTRGAVAEKVRTADVVIGAVLVPGATAPKLVTRAMLLTMKPGAVLVDVAIDQGGCFETSHATTHDDPTFVVDGIVHYCVAAPTIGVLIGARAVQGIGAALLVPQSLAIIATNFPKEGRGRAIGTWAAASSITTALGPPLGGFLVDLLSWRVAFWINVPLAVIALWLTWRYVPENRDEGAKGPIDWPGAAIAVLSLGALTYGLTAISEEGASGTVIVAAIILGLVGLAVFVFVEMRVANPIMPLELFRSRVFTGTNIVTVFLYGALGGALFLLPFDLQVRRGLTAAETGLALLPIGIVIGVLSRYTGGLADKFGPRPFLVIGSILVGLCNLGLALNLSSLWLGVIVPILLLSVGMAVVVSPLTTAVMNSVPDTQTGAASGINNAASRVAGVLAIAIFGAAAALVFSWYAPEGALFGILPPIGDAVRAAAEAAFARAYSTATLFGAAWCFLAAAVAYVTLPSKPREAAAGDRDAVASGS